MGQLPFSEPAVRAVRHHVATHPAENESVDPAGVVDGDGQRRPSPEGVSDHIDGLVGKRRESRCGEIVVGRRVGRLRCVAMTEQVDADHVAPSVGEQVEPTRLAPRPLGRSRETVEEDDGGSHGRTTLRGTPRRFEPATPGDGTGTVWATLRAVGTLGRMTEPNTIDDGLVELGHTPPLPEYVRDLWTRREFAIYVPFNDLRVQKMDTALGQLWHFINPAITVLVYYLIFGVLLEIDRGIDNYVGFLVIGVLTFTTTTRIAGDAVGSIARDSGLIRTIQFPRALLPVTSVVQQTLAFGPAIIVLLVTLLLTGEVPSAKWLLLPFGLFVHFLLNLGIALCCARAGFAVRDLTQMVQHVFRLLFYASGVLFLPSRFVTDETVLKLFALNPLYDILVFMRWILMDLSMGAEVFIALMIYAISLPIIGMVFFIRGEHKYGGS